MTMLSTKLIEKLQKLASLPILSEEEDTYLSDVCGNLSDAYEMGERDGQILLARGILKSLVKE